jgi:hypothetical protein
MTSNTIKEFITALDEEIAAIKRGKGGSIVKEGIWGQILSLMSSPKLSFYNNIFMQHHGMVPCSYEQHVQ